MTKISNIYDRINQIVSTALGTGYNQLPNPYSVVENPEVFLKRGYGIAVAEGENTERIVSAQRTYRRAFSVSLINQITTTDTNVEARKTIEKAMLEDVEKIFSAIEADPSFGGYSIKSAHVSDGGFVFIDSERAKYLGVTIDIQCEYLM